MEGTCTVAPLQDELGFGFLLKFSPPRAPLQVAIAGDSCSYLVYRAAMPHRRTSVIYIPVLGHAVTSPHPKQAS